MRTLEAPNGERERLERLLKDIPLPLLAARIKQARAEADISHDRLGELAGGMYRQNLINLEKGKNRPRLSTLRRIAEATEKSVDWFLDQPPGDLPFPNPGESAKC